MAGDPGEINWGKRVTGGEYSLEDAVAHLRAEEEADQRDVAGFLGAVKGASNTEVISAADLPEAPEAFATALAVRLEHLIPKWPTTPSDPLFDNFLTSMITGAADLHPLRAVDPVRRARNYHEIEQRALRWRKGEGQSMLGQRALLLVEADWLECTYEGSGSHGTVYPHPGKHDNFEGYIVDASTRPFSAEMYGEVTLVNGVRRSGSELEGRFRWLTLRPLVAFDGKNPENPSPNDFKPLVAFAGPSDLELPEFMDADREHWRLD